MIWTIGAVVLADNGNTQGKSVKAGEKVKAAVDNHHIVLERVVG